MKSVMLSIQPYYVFLIIARIMGWNIPQEKKIEVRKSYPKADDWDRKAIIYCSKNRKSFKRIPKEYQPLMRQFLGKVVGEFVCDRVVNFKHTKQYICGKIFDLYLELFDEDFLSQMCLSEQDFFNYAKNKDIYGWHISELKIYDKPKEISWFRGICKYPARDCGCCPFYDYTKMDCIRRTLHGPFQSWGYVESYVTN